MCPWPSIFIRCFAKSTNRKQKHIAARIRSAFWNACRSLAGDDLYSADRLPAFVNQHKKHHQYAEHECEYAIFASSTPQWPFNETRATAATTRKAKAKAGDDVDHEPEQAPTPGHARGASHERNTSHRGRMNESKQQKRRNAPKYEDTRPP